MIEPKDVFFGLDCRLRLWGYGSNVVVLKKQGSMPNLGVWMSRGFGELNVIAVDRPSFGHIGGP